MNIFDDYDQKLDQLHKAHEAIIEHFHELPDASYQAFSVEAEIRNFSLRKERLSIIPSKTSCHLCDQFLAYEEVPTKLGKKKSFNICSKCIDTISLVRGTTEFEMVHELQKNTLNQDITGALHPLIKDHLIRQSEKCWLIHDVVYDLYYKKGRTREALDQSWIEDIEKRLALLKQQLVIMADLNYKLPDSYMQDYSHKAQIKDLEGKLERIDGGLLPYRCSHCGSWIKEAGRPTFYGTYTICMPCKKVLRGVMTIPEAEKKYDLRSGTIRRDITRGKLTCYEDAKLLRRSGSIWILHEIVVQDKYKELPEHTSTTSGYAEIPNDLLERSRSVFNRLK
ncbi:hypothetical protein PaeCFBP13512_22110 [Paenibacillus sp. CFBP13512]|uniref:hypothetical protein n=1 Tax=Paenibacillus sp. CFBP13512 TaxID=2184007 RepID=UPI0010C011D0|nr:hypothetical protein [Paenibacillus sp. CFBP13512]TKJ83817.1 hypothetical protein PaeCFBP13512_22110 [Paenibacillus sp. CFBP13512]